MKIRRERIHRRSSTLRWSMVNSQVAKQVSDNYIFTTRRDRLYSPNVNDFYRATLLKFQSHTASLYYMPLPHRSPVAIHKSAENRLEPDSFARFFTRENIAASFGSLYTDFTLFISRKKKEPQPREIVAVVAKAAARDAKNVLCVCVICT
ncbi:unnamed protein product [Trichogramma brassicae]|uniref:Uncharacterized protein n=1 Tax=Trichogramma brassicae TaxID=86971 RepID=A0A6H5IHJ8_9HYME|nr:unnamed protein product [Trichogramma brassicae]